MLNYARQTRNIALLVIFITVFCDLLLFLDYLILNVYEMMLYYLIDECDGFLYAKNELYFTSLTETLYEVILDFTLFPDLPFSMALLFSLSASSNPSNPGTDPISMPLKAAAAIASTSG